MTSLRTAIMLSAIALGFARLTVACLTDQQKKDVAFDVYAAQQQACIDQYADKPSIDKCRDRVKAKWATDAGTDAEAGK